MSFLLDTCTVAEATKLAPNPGVLTWLEGQPSDLLFVSVLSLGEIEKGIELLPKGAKRTRLITWIESLRVQFFDRIVPIDDVIGTRWGKFAAASRKAGRPLSTVDGLIAATAYVRGLTVVTRNVNDFESTRVDVLDPWRP